jgi:CheY-like chemotaxis protein
MLDVFKMEQHLDDAQSRIPVDLGALCIHAQNIVKSRLRREHVEVQLKSPPPGDVFVMSDPSLLLQFLTHLAAAAETFAYPTDCITIVCDVCESSTPHQRRIFLGVAESERSHTSQTKSRKKAFKRQGLSEEKIDELDVLPKGTESSSTEKVSHLEDKIEDLYSDDPTLEIPSTRAYSALSIHLTNLIVQSLNRQRHGFLKSKLTSIEPNRLPVQGADEVRTAKFTSDPKLNEDQLEKYQPGYITFMEIELELALGYTEHQPSYMFCLDDEYTFNPVGELRVLIADDQRTMRSMLAMLFQNTCSKFPKMSVLLSTALSAEEAVRLSKKNNFKMVIIDENFSSEYCSRMKSQQSKVLEILNVGNMATLTSSNRLMIDSNKSNSYNARTTFFADEALKHEILEGDGSITGHEATKLILTNHDLSLGAPPIVFTITGDVLRSDVDSYYRSGSSGVLPKPTMMLDFHEMIEKRTKVRWPCPSLKYIFQAYVENNLN